MSRKILALFAFIILSGSTLLFASDSPPRRYPIPQYQRGWNMVCWGVNCAQTQISVDSIKRMKETGASHVVVVVNYFVWNKYDSVPKKYMPKQDHKYGYEHKTYTEADLIRIFKLVKNAGMKMVLKPHIEIVDKDFTFRGKYNPEDKAMFYLAYKKIWEELLKVSAPYFNNLSDVVVGTELMILAARDTDEWRKLIKFIRGKVPSHVKATFASNWFDFFAINFWDDLDWIGIDAYYPISTHENPTMETLEKGWKFWIIRLNTWRARYWPNKPIGFTEVGFVDRAGSTQFSWRSWETSRPIDQGEQARAFAATLNAVKTIDNFYGLYWWVWDVHTKVSPQTNISYSTVDRLANDVVKVHWANKLNDYCW